MYEKPLLVLKNLRLNNFRLVSGDLFDMLLPMLSIYQEYVRNHHYSLQVLTECKSNTNFATVLKRLEGKFLRSSINVQEETYFWVQS